MLLQLHVLSTVHAAPIPVTCIIVLHGQPSQGRLYYTPDQVTC